MTKRQLFALFVVQLVNFTEGNAVGALLPVYAGRLGADTALAGFYLSWNFAGLALGTIAAGWLSDRLQRRKALLVIAGVVQIVPVWLMGQVANMGQLFVFTFIVTFTAGIQLTMVSTLAGLFAEESERGRVFGILGSAAGLGGFIGGLMGGPIVDRWGFSSLFTVAALVTTIQPLAGLLLQDRALISVAPGTHTSTARSALKSRVFLLLFIASTLAFVTNGVQGLGKPLMMDGLGFSTTAISSTVAVAGLINLPFPLALGWLSDRAGRKPLLMFCYFASTVSLIILVASIQVWHFWLSTALQSVVGASIVVGSALVTDLVPPEALGSGLALFGATNWIGLVIGFAGTGVAIQRLGMAPTLISGAVLALVAVILLLLIRRPAPEYTGANTELLS